MRRAGHGIMRYFEKRSGYCVFFRYLFQRREYNPLIIPFGSYKSLVWRGYAFFFIDLPPWLSHYPIFVIIQHYQEESFNIKPG